VNGLTPPPDAGLGAPPVAAPRHRRPATLAHRAEYLAMRAAFAGLGALSWERASALGARLGRLGYWPLGIRRGVVERQVAAAFPGLAREEVRRIALGAYESLGRTSVETALIPDLPPERILELVDAENWGAVERALAMGKGLIIVAGHLGNWEMGGSYVAARGVPLEAVARGQGNPLFDAYLTETRTRAGMSVVYDHEAVRRIPRALKQNHAVALLFDQGALGLASTWVPFFGRLAKTPRGPAVFALRMRAPMLFAAVVRKPHGRFALSFEPITVEDTGDRERDVDTIVGNYTRVLEKWVRRVPEQYFWHHRRWKHQRPDTPPELGEP